MKAHPQLLQELENCTLPSPPVVATRLLELARDPELEVKPLVSVISRDSALSAKLLRVANSPMYAQFRNTETLPQAIRILGLNSALSLALSFSLLQGVRGTAVAELDLSGVWRRSFLAAICARSLAETLRSALREEMFMAALLQDLGLLALAKLRPKVYAGEVLNRLDPEALTQHERAHFGVDHTEVGGWLLNRWNMPARTVEAVERSHGSDQALLGGSSRAFNEVVALSGPIADLFLGKNQTRDCARVFILLDRLLGLGAEQLEAVLSRIGDMVPEAEVLFDMKLVQNPEDIVEQARQLLMFRQLTESTSAAR